VRELDAERGPNPPANLPPIIAAKQARARGGRSRDRVEARVRRANVGRVLRQRPPATSEKGGEGRQAKRESGWFFADQTAGDPSKAR